MIFLSKVTFSGSEVFLDYSNREQAGSSGRGEVEEGIEAVNGDEKKNTAHTHTHPSTLAFPVLTYHNLLICFLVSLSLFLLSQETVNYSTWNNA